MKTCRFLLATSVIGILAAWSRADLIPASRLTTWTPGVTVGVPGGIPTNRTHLIDVTQPPYNADKTGATDTHDAIMAAVVAAYRHHVSDPTAYDVVYLPAGTYRLNSDLNIQIYSNFTLRGDGDTTIIDVRTGVYTVFSLGADQWPAPTAIAISGSPAKGATSITVADASSFTIGHLAIIALDNDATIPVIEDSGGTKVRTQTVLVTNIVGNVLTISPGIFVGLPSGANPVAKAYGANCKGVGIEDLKIDCTNGNPGITIMWTEAYGCWVKNVTSYLSGGYHFLFSRSLNGEVRHCHIDNSANHASNGSGIKLDYTCSTLIEDNIIEQVFPSIEENLGSSGNVIASNVGIRSYSSAAMAGASFDANHQAHNAFSLYEGNVGEMFQADGYFGGISEVTVFRNWFRGYCPDATDNWKCVDLCRFTRNFNIVGNILGQPGYSWTVDPGTNQSQYATHYIYRLGFPNMGNGLYTGTANTVSHANDWANWQTGPGPGGFQELDLDVRRTTILKGNYNYRDNAIPSAESLGTDTLPNSLYLTSKPAWFGNLPWPAFDPTNPAPAIDAIPAGYRYVHGTEAPGIGTGTTHPPSNAKTVISAP